MCGRITNRGTPEQLAQAYQQVTKREVLDVFWPRFNAGPQSELPVIRQVDFAPEWARMRWGLIPYWSKDPAIGNKLFNARSETIEEKPAFREAFRQRRCLIPIDGFYEWKKLSSKLKQPYHIHLTFGPYFTLAGLWDRWRDPDSQALIDTFTVLTTEPNALLAEMHDRMPVIVAEGEQDVWLRSEDPDRIRSVLRPYPAEEMVAEPVSQLVNNVRNDSPECLDPVVVQGGLFQ